MRQKAEILIGIDPGVTNGFAVTKDGKILQLAQISIWQLFDELKHWSKHPSVQVHIEDARQRTWYGDDAEDKKFGAGWIKCLCGQYEEFCKAHGIDVVMRRPVKNGTKVPYEFWRKMTKWPGPNPGEHARDSLMLIHQL